jgi:ABC-type dipeptide/oligopeptide/nickel transport system permease subunit
MVSLKRNKKTSEVEARRSASQWAVAWRRFKKHKSGLFGLGMIVVLLAVAVLNVYIAPYPARPAPGAFGPLYQGEAGQPPSWKHLFGTTVMGTDVYSEVIHASVYTIYVAVLGTVLTMLGVIAVGVVSGYMGKYTDEVLMRLTEVFLVFPSLMLILIFVRIFQLGNAEPFFNLLGIKIPVGLSIVIAVVALFGWAAYARVVRGEVMKLKNAEFIQAAKSLGASDGFIMTRHVLPNILSTLIVIATLTMASVVLVEAVVSFLGFGDPNTVTWGSLMQENLDYLSTAWWGEVFPGIAVFLTILAFNLMGDGLSDALNPRLRE